MATLNLTVNTKVLQTGASLTATLTPSTAITDTATLAATFLPFGSAPGVLASTTAATAAGMTASSPFAFMASSTPQTATYTPTQSGVLTLTLTDTQGYATGTPLTIWCGGQPNGTVLTGGGFRVYTATVNVTATGNTTVVPGISGLKIIPVSYLITTGSNPSSVYFASSDGGTISPLTSTKALAANSNITRQSDSFGYSYTLAGESLVINSTATGVGVDITFAVG